MSKMLLYLFTFYKTREHTSLGGASADRAGVRREFPRSHKLLPICQWISSFLTNR